MDNNCESGCSGCSHGCGAQEEPQTALTFTDENGNDVKFEILDVVVLENEKQFLIVVEAEKLNDENAEAIILEIIKEDGQEFFETVTEDKLADEVFNKYLEQNKE